MTVYIQLSLHVSLEVLLYINTGHYVIVCQLVNRLDILFQLIFILIGIMCSMILTEYSQTCIIQVWMRFSVFEAPVWHTISKAIHM